MLSGNYNYNNYIPYNVPVRSPGSGLGEMVNALVNGYMNQPQQKPPMQLAGAAQPNFLSAIFGAQPPIAAPAASPSTDGGFY